MPHIISVVNQKGGVGKTTTVVHLSAALARLGYPVLVIDLDPQANVSITLGLQDPYEVKSTAATVLFDKEGTASPWYETIEERVSLIYGHVQLTKVERDLGRSIMSMPQFALQKRIAQMALDDDHIVLIDCPPALSLLTVNALVASRYCIVPMESGSRFSLEGYDDLEEVMQDVREVNTTLAILGILITRHDGRKNVCKAMRSAIERRFREKVFQTAIVSSARIQEAETNKKTIFQHDRQSNGARDFMELGREVLIRLHLPVLAVRTQDEESEPATEETRDGQGS